MEAQDVKVIHKITKVRRSSRYTVNLCLVKCSDELMVACHMTLDQSVSTSTTCGEKSV